MFFSCDLKKPKACKTRVDDREFFQIRTVEMSNKHLANELGAEGEFSQGMQKRYAFSLWWISPVDRAKAAHVDEIREFLLDVGEEKKVNVLCLTSFKLI